MTNIECKQDLWEYLAASKKTVVMYGMGNGADKILRVCEEKGVTVSDFFASDGFVRGHSFHGKTVLSWQAVKEKYGVENLIVLLSFGTSRSEVMQTIYGIAAEAELYAPDVPAFGNGVFDRAFFEAHIQELEETRSLLCDEESRRIFDNVLRFKLTGNIRCLKNAESDRHTVMKELICPEHIKVAADLGAYNGDTVRELLDTPSNKINTVFAVEPDARNFRKLSAYAETETRAKILPVHAGAWSQAETLYFDESGNRNASFETNRSATLSERPIKRASIEALPLDRVLGDIPVDYIKYDVEGAEAEALLGSKNAILRNTPTLLVSLYHRNEDLFVLPLLVKKHFPAYQKFYLRRFAGIPAWDLNLYCKG